MTAKNMFALFGYLRMLAITLIPIWPGVSLDAGEIIARWNFQTRENLTVFDETGKHHGTIRGNIDELVIAKGLDGNAFLLDEGRAYVEVPSDAGISVVNDFTFSCTIKPSDVAGYRTIFWKGDRRKAPEAVQYYLNLRDGKVEFKAKKSDGGWVSWVTSEACTFPDRWAAITTTFKDGVCVIYVNGVKRNTNIPPDTAGGLSELVACDHPLYFGTAQGAGGAPAYNFRGLIDDITFRSGTDIEPDMTRIPVLAATVLADTFRESSVDLSSLSDESRRLAKEVEHSPAMTKMPLAPVLAGAASVQEDYLKAFTLFNTLGTDTLSEISKIAGIKLPAPAKPPLAAETRSIKALLDTLASSAEILSMRSRDFSTATAEMAKVLSARKDTTTEGVAQRVFDADNALRAVLTLHTASFRSWILQTKQIAREVHFFSSGALFAAIPLSTGGTVLRRNDILGTLADIPEKVVLSLAQNEYEGFQILLIPNPAGGAIDGVKVTAGIFTHSSGNGTLTNITTSPMKTVNNQKSLASVKYRGDVYDAIKDGDALFSIPPKSPLAIYTRFHAEEGVKAGLYRGTITATKGSFSFTLPVEITVYNFALPKKSALKVAFSFFENFYTKWYGESSLGDEKKLSIYRQLLSYRITPNNIYSKETSPSIAMLARLPEANFCTYYSFQSTKPLTDGDLDKISREVGEKRAELKALGFPEKDMYLYSYDEFGVQTIYNRDSARQFCERLRKDYPGIKLMQTSVPAPPFDTYFNVWIPPMEVFQLVKPEYRAPGSELWWYWVSPPEPFPSFDLGFPMHHSRMLMLLGFKYNIEGCLYWSINREWMDNLDNAGAWVNGEWTAHYINIFTKKYTEQAGQGNLVYPGPEGRLWPSLRFENMRDGIEDYDYCAMLKSLLSEIKAGKRKADPSQVKDIEALVAMPDDVIKSTSEWTREPSVLNAYRTKVARMIETLTK